MNAILRPATPDDLARVCAWAEDAETLYFMFPAARFPLTPEQLQQALAQRHAASVLEIDGQPAGFADFIALAPELPATLGHVIVDPARRRQGVGRALVEAMCRLAWRQGAVDIHATCFDRNAPALALYQRLGFAPVGWRQRTDYAGRTHLAFDLARPPRAADTEDGVDYDDDPTRIDFDWLTGQLAQTYWSPGIGRPKVELAARHSTVVMAAYAEGRQIAYARVLSDGNRFGYLADVIVDPAWRGRGIATRLLQRILAHPRIAHVENCYLMTFDAHAVYRPLGFEVYPRPERFMWRGRTPAEVGGR
ncbi:GNAT family N-acetyltransferase [Chitiniphilus shinanonensis]|uniref:GNAT family N-acetyltransferase n=1 Tax=Chitiniphilus shinanonensis TaxID=553088 RepID=UPI00306F87FD